MRIKEVLKRSKIIKEIYYFVYKIYNKVFSEKKIRSRIQLLMYYFSKECKELKKFKGIHRNQRCFIIGNGPSLTAEDLDLLKSEITIGTNRIFNIFNKTEWRPTYYMVQDYLLLNNMKDEISKVKVKKNFYPINIKWKYNLRFKDACYFYMNTEKYFPSLPKFSEDISRQIFEGFTVTYGAIQLAVYMGFKEIYLLGVDFNYSVIINNYGEITFKEGVKDYFTNDSNLNQNLNLPNLENSLLAYKAAEKFCTQNGIRILNATRGGRLEVFERVKLGSLFLGNQSN